MSRITIDILPLEILDKILLHISNIEDHEVSKATIKSVRLVSQRFRKAGSRFLVKGIIASVDSQSLSKLEAICQHEDVSKFITQITIDASYYDVRLAQDRRQYGNHCGSTLYQMLEIMERSAGFRRHSARSRGEDECEDEVFDKRVTKLFEVEDQFRKLDDDQFDSGSPTEHQAILMGIHEEYVKLTTDQENVRLQNHHIQRLCVALKNLPALDSIILTDGLRSRFGNIFRNVNDSHMQLNDPSLFDLALSPSTWSGSFVTAYTTSPPIELLGELMSQLGKTGVRPRTVKASLTVPVDLRVMRITQDQHEGIHELMSKASQVDIRFLDWARMGSLAENNDRSHDEMAALGSVIKALTDSPDLKSLKVDFQHYPVFYQFPTANLSDLLPLKSVKWTKLESIQLSHLPFDLEDLVGFVHSHRNVVKNMVIESMYLRANVWSAVVDVLRKLEYLQEVDLSYPQGGGYDRFSPKEFPREKVNQYILKAIGENPLRE